MDANAQCDRQAAITRKSGKLDTMVGFASLIKIFKDSISDTVFDKSSEVLSNPCLISMKFKNDRAMLFNAIGMRYVNTKKTLNQWA